MSGKILVALAALALDNDNHWTQDGAPRLDTVRMLSGDQSVTREQINAAAPGFSRTNPTLPGKDGAAAQNGGQAAQSMGSAQGTPTPAIAAPASGTQAAAGAAQGGGNGEVEQEGAQGSGSGEGGDNDRSEVKTLEDELAAAQAELAEVERAKVSALAAYDAAVRKVDGAITRLESVRGKETSGDAIRGYLERQRQELAERAARRAKLNASGVDLKELVQAVGAAPIDQAMARKNQRGGMRPPVMAPKV